MKAKRFLWLALALSVVCGCNQKSRSPAAIDRQETKSAPPPGTNGPPTDVRSTSKQTNEWGFIIGETIEETKKRAESGDVSAQLLLGLQFYKLSGGTNYAEAFGWLRKAAEQGSYLGQFLLGQCYRDGLGVAKDEKESAKWLQQATENPEAAKWLRALAEQGGREMMWSIGR